MAASQRVLIPYKPRHAGLHGQMESRRFFVLVAHRRFGKTVVAINHLIKQALQCRKAQGHFAYVAPFRVQAKAVVWDYLKHYTRVVQGRIINETELAVTLPCPAGVAKVRIFGADNPDSLRGLYYDGVVLDEVAQMKPFTWEEIIQPALADRQGFAVFIGTPKGQNLFSELYHFAVAEQARGSEIWGAACYPVDRTNCLKAEEVERLREELSPQAFRQEMLCDFTASSDDRLITTDMVERALNREPDARMARMWPLVIGVDVARFGMDATVFFPRRGPLALSPQVHRKRDNMEVVSLLANYAGEIKPDLICVDQGQGTGVIDALRSFVSCPVVEVPFGAQALDNKRYVNRRAEMWTLMRDWLKGGAVLPASHAGALRAELPAPAYGYDAQGRIKLEAKDEIRKRLKHSTDIGDALALTFASPEGLTPRRPSAPDPYAAYGAGGPSPFASYGGGEYDPFGN